MFYDVLVSLHLITAAATHGYTPLLVRGSWFAVCGEYTGLLYMHQEGLRSYIALYSCFFYVSTHAPDVLLEVGKAGGGWKQSLSWDSK